MTVNCVCVCGVYESNRMVLLSSHIRSFVFRSFLFSWSPCFSTFLWHCLSLSRSHTDSLTPSTLRPYYKIKNSDSAPKRAVLSRSCCALSTSSFSRSLSLFLELYIKKLWECLWRKPVSNKTHFSFSFRFHFRTPCFYHHFHPAFSTALLLPMHRIQKCFI